MSLDSGNVSNKLRVPTVRQVNEKCPETSRLKAANKAWLPIKPLRDFAYVIYFLKYHYCFTTVLAELQAGSETSKMQTLVCASVVFLITQNQIFGLK